LDGVYSYLPRANKVLFEMTNVTKINRLKVGAEDNKKTITLNRDYSFNIPVIKYETIDKRVHYYQVNFLHVPKNNKLVFEAVQVSEIQNLDKPSVASVEPNIETGATESGLKTIVSFSNESSYPIPKVKTVGLDEEKTPLFDRVSFIEDEHYFLTFPSDLTQSTMSYYSDRVRKNGAVFELDYVDAGGSGMDGYPNVGIGGAKTGGTWYPGDRNLTGMPVKLRDLDDSMILQWEVSQENAWGDKDKWMASINMIFDGGEARLSK
jgi:hypothetical protein